VQRCNMKRNHARVSHFTRALHGASRQASQANGRAVTREGNRQHGALRDERRASAKWKVTLSAG
jgi:hypothetical protein